MCQFLPGSSPSNPVAIGLKPTEANKDKDRIETSLGFNMALHRALLCGNGFYDTLRRRQIALQGGLDGLASLSNYDGPTPPLPVLATVNYLEMPDYHVDALLEDVLPQDRTRFRYHFSNVPLGLAIISAVCFFPKRSRLE